MTRHPRKGAAEQLPVNVRELEESKAANRKIPAIAVAVQQPELGHPAPAKRVLWKRSAAAAALILVFLMWQCGSALVQGRKLADAAVRHFHQQLNAGDYEGIYREADQGFGRGQDHEESIRFLEAVHRKLGLAGPETRLNIRVETNPGGAFLTTQYSTTFAAGTATEMFTWVKSGGTLKLNGYHIQSNALILD